MKQDKTLTALMDEIRSALIAKDAAEKARVHAEERKAKAHKSYVILMDEFRAKEYVI